MLRISIDRTTAHRVGSLAVAVFYGVLGYAVGGGHAVANTMVFCAMPLAMIWLPTAMGDYTGPAGRGGIITKASPASIVRLLGWMFMLLPVGFAVVSVAG